MTDHPSQEGFTAFADPEKIGLMLLGPGEYTFALKSQKTDARLDYRVSTNVQSGYRFVAALTRHGLGIHIGTIRGVWNEANETLAPGFILAAKCDIPAANRVIKIFDAFVTIVLGEPSRMPEGYEVYAKWPTKRTSTDPTDD